MPDDAKLVTVTITLESPVLGDESPKTEPTWGETLSVAVIIFFYFVGVAAMAKSVYLTVEGLF